MPDWVPTTDGSAALDEQVVPLREELAAVQATLALVSESYADLENLYRDDAGWAKVGQTAEQFTPEGRKRMAALADLTATGNALIKRGVNLRIGYVWGEGVTASIKDDGADGQDVNAVFQLFWDDPTNRAELTGAEAQARYERRLATGGEAFWAFPTNRVTGRVYVRRIPAAEIVDRVCNPDDAAEVWFYKRVWNVVTRDPRTGAKGTQAKTTYYPALGFAPASRPTRVYGEEVRWDAPMRPVTVNCPGEDWRGLGDVLAAMPWARMDKEFLEDLAVYMRALTRILGTVTGGNSRTTRAAAAALRETSTRVPPPGAPAGPGPGSWAAMSPDMTLSMVSKSGAQIDATSSQPFATRAAAALEVPVTMLLGDPGVSGARAVAETLDQPTENMARSRRAVHTALFRDIADYVIDQAVIAPAGPLTGTVTKDGNRTVVTLPEGDQRTIEVVWPEFDSTPLKDFVAAVAVAYDTGKLPDVETFKLLANAFGIKDIDDLIDELTDDDGNWIDPTVTAGDVAVEAWRRGQDPADRLS